MTPQPDPERLAALDKRLSELRSAKVRRAHPVVKGLSQGEAAWRMVIEMATGIALGAAIGYGLDRVLGTLPVLLVIFCLLGFGAGVRTMMKTAQEVTRRAAADAAREGVAGMEHAGNEAHAGRDPPGHGNGRGGGGRGDGI